jgi:ATP-binding cassette subfamily F protein 3
VEVREGRLWEYAGDYDYYLEKRDEGLEPRAQSREPEVGQRPGSQRQPVAFPDKIPDRVGKARSKQGRRADAEARQRKSREIAPLRSRLKELEAEIAKIEARARDLTDQMANPELYREGDRVREVARERKALEEQAAALYGKWEELALRLETATGGDPS